MYIIELLMISIFYINYKFNKLFFY